MLDFEVFTPDQDSKLKLRRSKQTLAAGATDNPVFAIANYFFDCIRQDFLHLTGGRLKAQFKHSCVFTQ